MGFGVGTCSPLLTHGQAAFPSQQEREWALAGGQECLDSAAWHGWTWESWITSPKNKPTMDFKTVTEVRVARWMGIPIFFSKPGDSMHRLQRLFRVELFEMSAKIFGEFRFASSLHNSI